MRFVVYSSDSVPFLLVPECFSPAADAVRLYGHLKVLGTVSVPGAIGDIGWHRVVADIEQHSYAILGDVEAGQLFGKAYAGLNRQRQSPQGPVERQPIEVLRSRPDKR